MGHRIELTIEPLYEPTHHELKSGSRLRSALACCGAPLITQGGVGARAIDNAGAAMR